MINVGDKEKENTKIQNDTNDLIKINLDKPDVTKIVLLKKVGIPFKKDENIAKCYISDNKEKLKYIKSPIYGWILKYISEEKKLILEPCKHDTFYVNLCVKCGFKKTEQYDNQNITKGYGFLTSDFTYSKDKAESLEKYAVKNYLKEQKLILLLDLDNTIIHTSQIRILPEEIKKLQDMYKDYFAKVPIRNEFNRNDIILVKFRPFLKTFLKNIKNKYEVFIYTQGTKEYATAIIQYININFENDSLSTNRMMYRILDENGFAKIKSIKNVFPTQENMILIIDDIIEVWNEKDHLIQIYPYKFFSEKEKATDEISPINGKNIMKEKFLRNEYDNVLFCITNLLLCVHRKFFEFYSKFNFQKSIKRITSDLLMTIFHGKKFYYHLNYYNCPIPKSNKKNKKPKECNNNNNIKTNVIIDKKENNLDNKEKSSEDNLNNQVKKEDNININNNNNNNKDNDDNNGNMVKDIKNDNNNVEKEKTESEIKKRNLIEEKNVIKILKNKIKKLGGILIEEEKEKFNADLFLTDFYDETDPIIKSIEENNSNDKNKRLPILHCHYIEICLMYYYELCIDDFILSTNLKILKILDLNKIFMKNKINIINFYGNKEFIDEN